MSEFRSERSWDAVAGHITQTLRIGSAPEPHHGEVEVMFGVEQTCTVVERRNYGTFLRPVWHEVDVRVGERMNESAYIGVKVEDIPAIVAHLWEVYEAHEG